MSTAYQELILKIFDRYIENTHQPSTSTKPSDESEVMAKKKEKPAIREKPVTQANTWQASKVLHPPPYDVAPGKKRAVRKAHKKHRYDLVPLVQPHPPSATPTLADRFHALPSELRQHIFSFLLVQVLETIYFAIASS